jgi:hypothetical protein
MLEVDTALAAAGINAEWLQRRSEQMPRSPLDLMRAGAIGRGSAFAGQDGATDICSAGGEAKAFATAGGKK